MRCTHFLGTLVGISIMAASAATAYAQQGTVTATGKIGGTAAIDTSAKAQPVGKIEIVGGDTYNWGNVQPGELKATIQVKNTGQGDLKITDVHPGCGCTVTSPIDKNPLKPGETGS